MGVEFLLLLLFLLLLPLRHEGCLVGAETTGATYTPTRRGCGVLNPDRNSALPAPLQRGLFVEEPHWVVVRASPSASKAIFHNDRFPAQRGRRTPPQHSVPADERYVKWVEKEDTDSPVLMIMPQPPIYKQPMGRVLFGPAFTGARGKVHQSKEPPPGFSRVATASLRYKREVGGPDLPHQAFNGYGVYSIGKEKSRSDFQPSKIHPYLSHKSGLYSENNMDYLERLEKKESAPVPKTTSYGFNRGAKSVLQGILREDAFPANRGKKRGLNEILKPENFAANRGKKDQLQNILQSDAFQANRGKKNDISKPEVLATNRGKKDQLQNILQSDAFQANRGKKNDISKPEVLATNRGKKDLLQNILQSDAFQANRGKKNDISKPEVLATNRGKKDLLQNILQSDAFQANRGKKNDISKPEVLATNRGKKDLLQNILQSDAFQANRGKKNDISKPEVLATNRGKKDLLQNILQSDAFQANRGKKDEIAKPEIFVANRGKKDLLQNILQSDAFQANRGKKDEIAKPEIFVANRGEKELLQNILQSDAFQANRGKRNEFLNPEIFAANRGKKDQLQNISQSDAFQANRGKKDEISKTGREWEHLEANPKATTVHFTDNGGKQHTSNDANDDMNHASAWPLSAASSGADKRLSSEYAVQSFHARSGKGKDLEDRCGISNGLPLLALAPGQRIGTTAKSGNCLDSLLNDVPDGLERTERILQTLENVMLLLNKQMAQPPSEDFKEKHHHFMREDIRPQSALMPEEHFWHWMSV